MIKNKLKISLYSLIIIFIVVVIYLLLNRDSSSSNTPVAHPVKNIKTACNTKSRDTAFVLTIDGGAMRGILPAHVLAYIEKKTGRPIASLFDVIGGTSTGAIGVFALSVPGKNGQPKYSAKDLLSFYNNNGPYIFSVPLWYKLKTLNGLLGPKFLSSRKLDICNKYFSHVKMSQLLTGALVTGYDLDNNKTVVFTSWRARESSNHDFYVAPLLNAITSPPILYSPGRISNLINTRHMILLDGYVGAQDPTFLTYLTLRAHQHAKKYVVVSLGTGRFHIIKPRSNMKNWGLLKWILYVLPIMIQAQSQEENLDLKALYNIKRNWKQRIFDLENITYVRINVELPTNVGRGGFNASAQEIKKLNYYGEQDVLQNKKKLDWLIAKLKQHVPYCQYNKKISDSHKENTKIEHGH